MNTAWYVVKVLPGKERSLTEQFNKDIGLGRINKIVRFVCPTEKEFVVVKTKVTNKIINVCWGVNILAVAACPVAIAVSRVMEKFIGVVM